MVSMRLIAFSKDRADFYASPAGPAKIALCQEESKDAVKENNADIAILDGESYRVLRRERNYRHFREIYLPLDIGAGRLLRALAYSALYVARGRLLPYAVSTLSSTGGARRRFLKLRVKSRKKRTREFDYYPADWTPLDFLKFLDDMGIRYVALRWHDKILHDRPMTDLDLLVEDEDIPRIGKALKSHVGTKKIHMHSVGGAERQKLDQMAYFPPRIGRHILRNRVRLTQEAGYRPSDADYFLSLAYHAVVDKGAATGLPETPDAPADPENRFYKELLPLREKLGLDVGLDLESLAAHLEKSGWLPPSDRLAKFMPRNAWLASRIRNARSATDGIRGSYCVFVFRDIVRAWGNLDALLSDIRKMGFDILFEKELSPQERAHAACEIRGGNWAQSEEWGADGGWPFYVVLARDPRPLKMSRKQLTRFPFVENARCLRKGKWRDRVNRRLPKEKQANFVHASDNNHEALEYIQAVAPEAAGMME